MSRLPNEDAESPQLRRLQQWWLELPLAYRVNALLYFLGGVALLFLLGTLLSSDGRPRQVQVGAGVPVTTTSSTARPPSTTARATTTSSGPSTSSSSTTSTTQAAGASTTAQTSPATTRPVETTAATTAPATTTTAPANCRDSTNPACGAFAWDPAPAANVGLTVKVTARQPTAKVGELVTFDVVVDDPDHVVSDNCSEVRFDNGAAADGPCSPPPSCPPHYGPWTPPAAKAGHHNGAYANIWDTAGEHTATFTFRSWSPDTCLALDPYASEGSKQVTYTITVSVSPPGT